MDEVLSLMVGGVTFRRGQRCYGKRPFLYATGGMGHDGDMQLGMGRVRVDGEFGWVMRSSGRSFGLGN